ncbi:MAG TPA: capsule assembly Wzi family protein [Candidatus Tectomicrobia bacterium]|nr:capsule assembly Wzi family protein [Candidatus Tectomicrobia bacterium]
MVVSLLILCALGYLSSQSRAADRTNVPLRNWSGFAIHWHWTYDAIKKLALAGLTDRVVLNTKPMSRVEMARIVAQVIAKITGDEGGQYADRRDLEDTLYRLLEELQPELAELGVEAALQQGKPPGFFQIKPLANLQVRMAYAKDEATLENNQGDAFEEGVNGRLATFSRGQVGDFFSATLSPELRVDDKGGVSARVLEGFGKFTLYNVEAGGGRESLWWGPGFNGSMLFSTNARPFDLVKAGAAEPFTLPWIFESLGPIKLTYFLGQLEEAREFPRTKLTGIRLNLAPTSFLELGISRVVQFNGDGRPSVGFGDYLQILFGPGSDAADSPLNNNSLLSADFSLRLPNVSRYLPLFRDLEIYGELGWDDTCCDDIFIPLLPGGVIGLYSPNLFGSAQTELRIEYAATSKIQFNSSIYTSGYAFKGHPIAHFIGTRGNDLYVRIGRWFGPDVLVGVEFDRAKIGLVTAGTSNLPKEKRFSAGLDVSYRFSKTLMLFGAYRFISSDDQGSIPDLDLNNHLFRVEATFSF